MDLLDEVREAWGWTGIEPLAIIGENEFGNLMIEDTQGRYWRLCPEDLDCQVIATRREELDALSRDQEFLADWYMPGLCEQAHALLGALPPGRKYCLKIPGVLGGEYGGDNLAMIAHVELIRSSGHLGREIAELPEGAQVRLTVGE